MRVPPAAVAAAGRDEPLARLRHIGQRKAGRRVTNDGAGRYTDHQILSILTKAFARHAITTASGGVFFTVAEIHQRGQVRVGLKNHITPAPAIAAVRPTGRYIFFPPEGHAAIAACAGFDLNLCRIYKHISHQSFFLICPVI